MRGWLSTSLCVLVALLFAQPAAADDIGAGEVRLPGKAVRPLP